MSTLKERDREVIWHPYTPMKIRPESIGIVSGDGVYLQDEDGKRYIDAIASWWVNLHGHAHPHIAQRVSTQLQTLEHCIFAGFSHEPAVQLAERLLPILPGPMAKIFYSDNGSTAVEVAIKMALQYWGNKGLKKKKVVAIEGAYHGDTFGAMSVSGRSIFTAPFDEKLFDVTFIPFPEEGKEQESLNVLESLLQDNDVAAFIAEPLVQGTAGMRMYDPAILEQYFGLCKKYDALVIADEVMTGFGRTGPLFACDTIETGPDMVCLSKGLTGGTMAMGITATTQQVYDAFYDDDMLKTLYHGHSYTANPVSCAAALASLDLTLDEACSANRERIEAQHKIFAAGIKNNSKVRDTRIMGTILALELDTGAPTSYTNAQRDLIYNFFIDRNILLRPLGNIIYLMPPYCITNDELKYIYSSITDLINSL
ncbi:MAG: adenosylmethionine--8-amino-7-oxononanoate transaminase [Bacteroidetes bacterium 46-16]|nr:MAG: adenosylmethionine--8-amino-7-oxononanoate transaminase [Bacteroidetes bacterium 46-16]